MLVDAYGEGVDCAFMDNVAGGQLAGEYAARMDGPIHAMWVETELDQLFTTRVFEDRRRGFHAALTEAGREALAEAADARANAAQWRQWADAAADSLTRKR